MVDKKRNRWMLPGKPIVWLVAQLLSIVLLASLPLASITLTEAKYIAAAKSTAGARVAKWDVDVDVKKLPAKTKEIPLIPDKAKEKDHPLVLFFQGIKQDGSWVRRDACFPIELINDSEVSAKFTPKIKVNEGEANEAAVTAAVKNNIFFYDFGGDLYDLYGGNMDSLINDLYDASNVDVYFNGNNITITGEGENGGDLVISSINTNGVDLKPRERRDVMVVIKPCTFTGLKFWANVEQLD